MLSEDISLALPLDFSSCQLKNAFNRYLYISSQNNTILCYDEVLCYLSNVIGQGSIAEIEQNLKRYFSSEQIHLAYDNLHHALDYSLTILDPERDQATYSLLQQCSIDLIDPSVLLNIMETIETNQLFSYLPIFVIHDWVQMIRSVQNLEKFDIQSSSMENVEQQMLHLKENITSLDHLVRNFNHMSFTNGSSALSFNDQCCLRTNCTHNTMIYQSTTILPESPCSSWSSLDVDTHPLTSLPGFVRNPVTNFIMPTGTVESEMESSIISLDGNISSDEEPQVPVRNLTRSLSIQPERTRTRPMIIKRADVLWMYPAAVIRPRNTSFCSAVDESTDAEEFAPLFKRTNSCDMNFPIKNMQDPLPKKMIRKPKKPAKGSKGGRRN